MCALPGNFLFSLLHLMQLFGAPTKLGVSIRGLQGGGFLYAFGWCRFTVGKYGYMSSDIAGAVFF